MPSRGGEARKAGTSRETEREDGKRKERGGQWQDEGEEDKVYRASHGEAFIVMEKRRPSLSDTHRSPPP